MALHGPVEVRPADLKFGREVGQREAAVLEVENRLAEGPAILGEFHSLVERPLRHGLRLNGDRKSLLGQLSHEIGKALPFLAEKVRERDLDILEEELRRVRSMLANLVQVSPSH